MARTTQQLNQNEMAAYEKFCAEHNIVCDASEVGVANGNILGGFVIEKMDSDLTPASLAASFPQVRDQLVFKSAAQKEVESVVSGMTEDEKSITREFLKKQGQLVLDGDEGLENLSSIASWLRARSYPISAQNLGTALSNILNNGQRQLHWKPAAAQTEPYGRHSSDSRSFAPKSNTNRNITSSKHDHAKDQPISTLKNSLSADESRWMQMAEGLRGNTHSKTAEMQKIMRSTWRETYESRLRLLQGRNASI